MREPEISGGALDYAVGSDQAEAGRLRVSSIRSGYDQAFRRTFSLYADLLKRILLNLIYPDQPELADMNGRWIQPSQYPNIGKSAQATFRPRDIQRVMDGKDRYPQALTMIGMHRLRNLQDQVWRVVKNDIEGDFIETGVWRGGACIFMRGLLKFLGVTDRIVYAADSFEGFRPASEARYEIDQDHPFHERPILSVSLDTVKASFEKCGLLDEQVRFIRGWFSESLKDLEEPQKIAILRIDGDLYESHMDVFNPLYDRVVSGGVVICDDYNALIPAHAAVDEFRRYRGISEPIQETDWAEAWWIKE